MKEYRLQIAEREDLTIISLQVLELLLKKIKDSASRQMEIPAEDIMPPGYTKYLVNVLNSNREKRKFQFQYIPVQEICPEHIYQITAQQIQSLEIEGAACFKHFEFMRNHEVCRYKLDVEENFFYKCQSSDGIFLFAYRGQQWKKICLI